MKTTIAINGACGRMGQRILELAREDANLKLGAALELPDHPDQGRDVGEVWTFSAASDRRRSGPAMVLASSSDKTIVTVAATSAMRSTPQRLVATIESISPVWIPIRTRRSTPSGHASPAIARCASLAAATASSGRRKITKNESPSVDCS